MSFDAISLVLAAVLGFVGYFITYWHNLRLSKRSEQLGYINRQISEFYGPLFVLTQTGERAYRTLLYKLGGEERTRVFGDPNFPVTEEDVKEWRLWVENVFMPINLQIERVIVGKAYLLREEEMPACLLEFITHVAGYKVVLRKWQEGDFSENDSFRFPTRLYDYARDSYRELKAQQLRLIRG